jgi:hypothetical protein
MGSVGDACDDAMCESFSATNGGELLDRITFKARDHSLSARRLRGRSRA